MRHVRCGIAIACIQVIALVELSAWSLRNQMSFDEFWLCTGRRSAAVVLSVDLRDSPESAFPFWLVT
jgi:hypothetical protein